MKLFGVKAIDVLSVANGLYSFAKTSEEAHERVLITGGPGSGKTRLLELIVTARELLATGERTMDGISFIRPGNRTSKVVLSWQLTVEEQTTIDASSPIVSTEIIFRADDEEDVDARMRYLMERYGHDDATPKFEYFSERRRLDVGGGGAALDEFDQKSLRTNPSPRKFSWLPAFMVELPEEPAKAARFADVLERFSPSCAYDAQRHALTSRGRMLRSLKELSASEADAVCFAATTALIGLSGSIVLVDRPELHGIDPVRALAGLSALGTDNQLILASPSPVFAAGFEGVIIQLDAQTGADATTNRGPG